MSKISQYANSVAALGTDDLFDVSEKISSSPDVYESRKMTGAVLATFIQSYTSNILNTNSLTLGGNYTHDLAGNQLVFDGGNFGVVGEIGVTADDVSRTNVFVAGDYLGQSILAVKNAGNVGVGTLTPDASAVLDASSTDSGFLVPRMTTAQKTAISTPAESLIVYDTDLNRHEFYNSTGSWAAFDSNFANTNLTVGAGREHTLTDTVRIKGGTFQVEGLNTLGTASAFGIYDGDTTPALNWDFRNNGDVYLGKSEQVFYGADSNNEMAIGIKAVAANHNMVKVGRGSFRTPSTSNLLTFHAVGTTGPASGFTDNDFASVDFLFERSTNCQVVVAGSNRPALSLRRSPSQGVTIQERGDYFTFLSDYTKYVYSFQKDEGHWFDTAGLTNARTGENRTGVVGYFDGGLELWAAKWDAVGGVDANTAGDLVFAANTRNGSSFSNDVITISTGADAATNRYWTEFKNTGGSVALKINGNDALPQLPEFTVAGVPAADADNKGGFVCITDETGGYVTAFSDGTNWRRTTDRAIIS